MRSRAHIGARWVRCTCPRRTAHPLRGIEGCDNSPRFCERPAILYSRRTSFPKDLVMSLRFNPNCDLILCGDDSNADQGSRTFTLWAKAMETQADRALHTRLAHNFKGLGCARVYAESTTRATGSRLGSGNVCCLYVHWLLHNSYWAINSISCQATFGNLYEKMKNSRRLLDRLSMAMHHRISSRLRNAPKADREWPYKGIVSRCIMAFHPAVVVVLSNYRQSSSPVGKWQ